MRVLIETDIEGTAGVVSFEDQAHGDAKHYEEAKALATGEVNAAIEALVAEGIDDILVIDGHGPGGLIYELLHPMAKLLHGRPTPSLATQAEVMRGYDVCMVIGQHAMAGVQDGNLSHTQSSHAIDYYNVNGQRVGEIGQIALFEGSLGLPLIFVSGDEAACREAEALVPGITTAAVKKGLCRTAAISVSIPEAHRRIREGVASAVRKQRSEPLAPVTLPGPYVVEVRYNSTAHADGAAGRHGARRVDSQTVQFLSDNIRDVIYG